MPETTTKKKTAGPKPAAKPAAKAKAKPVVSIEAFQDLSARFDDLEERFNRLVKSHRFMF